MFLFGTAFSFAKKEKKLTIITSTRTTTLVLVLVLCVLISNESVASLSSHHHHHHQSRSLSMSRANIVAIDNGNDNDNNNHSNTNRLPLTTARTTSTSASASASASALPTLTNGNRRSFFLASATAGIISPSLVSSIFSNFNNNNANANANDATTTTTTTAAPAAAVVPSVSAGMSAFASNKVEESIEIYDSLISDDPRRKPYLWQRGLSLYYAERYKEGANQFETDVAVNPNDTEEQIWHLLSLSKMEEVGSLSKARSQKLTVGRDRRPVMRLVQQLFLEEETEDNKNKNNKSETQNQTTEQKLIDLATRNSRNNTAGAGASDTFYAALYLSLYYESLNNGSELLSQQYMRTAIDTKYAQSSGRGDPMVDVAKVALQRRGWNTSNTDKSYSSL